MGAHDIQQVILDLLHCDTKVVRNRSGRYGSSQWLTAVAFGHPVVASASSDCSLDYTRAIISRWISTKVKDLWPLWFEPKTDRPVANEVDSKLDELLVALAQRLSCVRY